MDFCSTFLFFGYGIFGLLVCLWTFKWVGGPLVGDFGCAVFTVESANPKNLDLNNKLNLIMIEIEI